jgi:hypothetical protein
MVISTSGEVIEISVAKKSIIFKGLVFAMSLLIAVEELMSEELSGLPRCLAISTRMMLVFAKVFSRLRE